MPTCSSTYEFRVRAHGDGILLAAGWGEYSEPASVTTDPCSPEFGKESYSFVVLDSASAGTLVGTVSATDPDDGDTLRYEITSGNEGGAFAIGETSGEISLAAPLGAAVRTEYSLTVEVGDGRGGRASVPVTVTVGASGCSGGIAVSDSASNPGLVSDCETLLGLRDAPAGTASLNWNGSTVITGWAGVTVGGRPQRVTEMSLRSRGLTGVGPAGLGDLSGLQVLDLQSNGLTGVIPSELGGLSNLNSLWLHENQLTGGIPSELGMLTNLIWVSLAENVASVSGATFTVGWSAVVGAGLYEVQHRVAGSGDEWARGATSTAVSLAYSPEGGPVCETSYEIRCACAFVRRRREPHGRLGRAVRRGARGDGPVQPGTGVR